MSSLFHVNTPVILLFLVFIAIAVRKVGRVHLPIWWVMLVAALIVLFTGDISLAEAYRSIQFDVLFYLFGVFVIGQALESSHYLEHVSLKVLHHAGTSHRLLGLMIVIFALSSALLMNDTVAIIATPVVLLLAKQQRFCAKPFLLALAYAITLGSVMSPVGNPQNLLIANSSGMLNPFATFLSHLFVPTVINLVILYVVIRLFFRRQLQHALLPIKSDKVIDLPLARLSQLSLLLLVGLIALKIVLSRLHVTYSLPLSVIALVACAPILLLSRRRRVILRDLDWHTLLFFVGLFVFMQSVWQSGYLQGLLHASQLNVQHKGVIFSLSVLLSQLVSNVPLVALYLPLLQKANVGEYLALAAGSTVAGNLLILGAASNVIVLQNATKRGHPAFSFWDFFKVGLPLTLCNVAVYYVAIAYFFR